MRSLGKEERKLLSRELRTQRTTQWWIPWILFLPYIFQTWRS
jgi:hypothetical protein